MANIGKNIGDFLGFDPTPGFNLGWKKTSSTGVAPTLTGTGVNARTGERDVHATKEDEGGNSEQTNEENNTNNTIYDGAAAVAAANAREQGLTVGMIDEEIAALRQRYGNLDGAASTGSNQIEDAYNKSLSRLNEQQSNALGKYKTQRSDTKADFQGAIEDNDRSAFNNYTALMGLLGRSGAGASSAAENVVPYAVSQTASKTRGKVSDTFGRNMRDLKTAEDETVQSYENSTKDLDEQRRTNKGNLERDILSKRSEIQQQLAAAEARKVQARGGNWQEAKAAMSDAVAKRNAMDQALATLMDRYRNPYTVQDVKARDATLQNYAYDSTGVAVDDPNGPGRDTDTSSDYLARLEEERRRKEEEQQV